MSIDQYQLNSNSISNISILESLNYLEKESESILSNFITPKNLKVAFMYYLNVLMVSSNSKDNELYRSIIKSPKKINKFLIKLYDCMLLDSFKVSIAKETYKDEFSNSARIYASKIKRLHKDPIAKMIINFQGPIFVKIPESKYLSAKYINNIKNNSLEPYPFAYKFSPFICTMYRYVVGDFKILESKEQKNFMNTFTSALNTKDIKFKKISFTKLSEFVLNTPPDNYFKIKKSVYLEMLEDAAIKLMTSKVDSTIMSISTLKKNVMFECSGYIYFNNLGKAELKYLKDNGTYKPFDNYGRIYGVLNSICKDVRNRMFKGLYEIDISSSALTVLLNVEFTNTCKEEENNVFMLTKEKYPAIFLLLSDKKRVRYLVAEALGISYEKAKELINSILFDPNRRLKLKFKSKRESQVNFTIKLLAELKELAETVHFKIFKSTDEENLFYKFNGYSIKEIREIIAEDIRINKFLKPKKYGRGKKYFGKKLFRFYSIIENEIRNTMFQYAKEFDTDCNQLHDCLFTDKQIKPMHMTNYIKYKTGYTILFESKEI